MAFEQNFSVAQSYLDATSLQVADTSTGTDVNITSRRIYIQDANGNYLVPSGTTTQYVLFPEPAATILINVLNQDYCLSITVQWLDVSNNILYTKTQMFCFTLYSEQFFYYLTQQAAAGNANIQDTTFYGNKMLLRVYIDSANNAVQYASDIVGAQNSLNSAAFLIDNQNSFF